MIVLDTHALVWWVSGQAGLLGAGAAAAIERERSTDGIRISSISAWEIALLVERQRLTLNREVSSWLAKVEQIPGVAFVPVTNAVAIEAVNLPGNFHRDPADRMIAATARILNASVVTKDSRLIDYPHIATLW
ncbi:MAG TPA: type II toxin-antitoxin system VapC family toxin [Bauldia sp.]|nr:type II toxin-antitoxin system VapC family toxin [Bauldia sp.]